MQRYGGSKLERTRDLFEQCIEQCPPKFAKGLFLQMICMWMHISFFKFYYSVAALYLLYAKLEEEHGLARHAMSVYERATTAVLPEQRFEVSETVLYFAEI